jgi:thiol-disulfide isomerase/thioredoxin
MLAAFASCNASSTKEKDEEKDRIEENEDDKKEEDETEETSEESEETVASEASGDSVIFSTTDRDGNAYDDSIFADYELTLINFWEPWCGPCVGEMPDLETLYENYSDKGLLVIGVYSEAGMEADVEAILEDSGITSPS